MGSVQFVQKNIWRVKIKITCLGNSLCIYHIFGSFCMLWGWCWSSPEGLLTVMPVYSFFFHSSFLLLFPAHPNGRSPTGATVRLHLWIYSHSDSIKETRVTPWPFPSAATGPYFPIMRLLCCLSGISANLSWLHLIRRATGVSLYLF